MQRTILLLVCLLVAGCTQGDAPGPDESADEVVAGELRGIVVDDTITPIEGAAVVVTGTSLQAVTDADGAFAFAELEPATYFLEVTHPLYAPAQVNTELTAAGVLVKVQLQRIIFAEPYTQQTHLKGFLYCSSNTGGVIAEECGEGVGVPCEAPVVGPVPILGCQRLGGAPDNRPEVTFFTDGAHIATIQAEVVWDPSFTVGNGVQEGGFTAIMATHFVCDPVCRYQDSLDDKVGHSPLIMRTDDGDQGGSYFTAPDVALAKANVTAETPVSVFVWTSDDDLAAVSFDQPFDVYVTLAYYLPLPEGWSFYAGDPLPF